MVFYGEQWVAEQESLAYSVTEPPPPETTEDDDPADAAMFANTMLGLDDDTDDGNVTSAGISPTMPTGPSPPRPEQLVTLEARTDAPPRIRRRHIPGPPSAQIPPLVLLLEAAEYEAT
eukprot:201702-Rhodomonas_salina.1